jgi:Zn-finger nucleic acid-binding protein
MKCTSCNQGELSPCFLEGQFRAHTCDSCGGNWILIEDYVTWKEHNPEFELSDKANFEVDDTKNALLCPVTGRIMQKFRIAHDCDHRLDYSASVGGVWLDNGEWDYLKQQNLAGSLNAILTAHWQKSIREDNAKATFSELYQSKFGEESYTKAREIRTWLAGHPNKADLRAYLLAEDPYSAER